MRTNRSFRVVRCRGAGPVEVVTKFYVEDKARRSCIECGHTWTGSIRCTADKCDGMGEPIDGGER